MTFANLAKKGSVGALAQLAVVLFVVVVAISLLPVVKQTLLDVITAAVG